MTMDDPQSAAEATDVDKVDDHDDYAGDGPGTAFPPERPMGSGRQTLTPTDEAFGESVAERDRRTNPDPVVDELDRAARAAPDEADLGDTGELDEVPEQAGQLVDPTGPEPDHEGLERDAEGQLLADRVGPAADPAAEEAAIHLLPDDAVR